MGCAESGRTSGDPHRLTLSGKQTVSTCRIAVGEDDAERVTAIITASFHDDPVWSFAFPDPTERPGQYEVFWRWAVDGAMQYDTAWLTPGGEAASVWVPPGGSELPIDIEETLDERIRDMMGADTSRLLETLHRFDLARPKEPHYYLSLLGTDPHHLGHGYGMSLMAENLAAIDVMHLPAHLESSNPANLDRYRRQGFSVSGSFDLPDNGPTVTTMWREAR